MVLVDIETVQLCCAVAQSVDYFTSILSTFPKVIEGFFLGIFRDLISEVLFEKSSKLIYIYSRFSRSYTARGYLLGNPQGYLH